MSVNLAIAPWDKNRLLVVEKRENNLVIETHTFLCHQGGILDAIEYVLHEQDFTVKDRLKFVLFILTRKGGKTTSSKHPHLSLKFYYLP